MLDAFARNVYTLLGGGSIDAVLIVEDSGSTLHYEVFLPLSSPRVHTHRHVMVLCSHLPSREGDDGDYDSTPRSAGPLLTLVRDLPLSQL